MSPDHAESGSAGDQRSWLTTTHWSVVLEASAAGSPCAAEALEQLCRTYWYPLYAFVRRRGYGATEAEDLTQEFFAHLLRRNFPAGIRPEGGRFRSYLVTALQHFLINEWENARAQKRGGGQPVYSLQALNAEDRYQLEPADHMTPEALFDRRWAAELLERVRQRLRSEYIAVGKGDAFDRLQPCLTGAELALPYAELAGQLGCSESGVKMAVHRMRRRYGQLLRQEISQTVARPEDVEEEIRALLAAL